MVKGRKTYRCEEIATTPKVTNIYGMIGRIYLDLVKLFFTNFIFEGFTMRYQVKDIDIKITPENLKVFSNMK